MTVPWQSIFGNDAPVEVEIGPGTGTFFLYAAQRSPDVNFFGIERSPTRAAALGRAVARQHWRNALVINADAACVIEHVVPAASVRAYHLYFPDPWWKRRHHRRRLLTDALAAALARTLVPGGRLHIATDVPAVFERAARTLDTVPAFVRVDGRAIAAYRRHCVRAQRPTPGRPHPRGHVPECQRGRCVGHRSREQRRTDDTGRVAEVMAADRRSQLVVEDKARHRLAPERVQFVDVRDAAAQHHEVGIEDVDHVRQGAAEAVQKLSEHDARGILPGAERRNHVGQRSGRPVTAA